MYPIRPIVKLAQRCFYGAAGAAGRRARPGADQGPGEPLAGEEPPSDFRCTLTDQSSHHLFVALMRRYSFHPFRYHGQRCTIVMVRLSRSYVNDTP